MKLDAHKSAVAKAYGLASAGYNKPALTFFSQGSKSLLDYAGLSPGQKILDVASGTGHSALYASARVGAHGSVIGIDIAEEMVALANAYAKQLSPRSNVRFERMDGETTTFADDEFDAVLCAYGIFFLPGMEMGSKSGSGYQKTGVGSVFRLLVQRPFSRSPICLKIACQGNRI